MKGIVFDRNRPGAVQNDWDGQFAIAALGIARALRFSYQTHFRPRTWRGKEVWTPFSKDGRLANQR